MKKQFVPITVVALCAACVMLFTDVKTDYNHSLDFSRYKTYSWIKVQAGDQLWQDRIQKNVDLALQEKGWQRSDSRGDAGITAFGSTQNQQTLQTFYDNVGGGWFWGGFDGTATTTVQNTPVGTLVVDIFDNQTKKLIWRGNSSDSLSGNPEKNEKKLREDVQKMFKDFPPKAKG